MRFLLGVHRSNWLEQTDVPLFVSRSSLKTRRRLPVALGPWALDSGGFSELDRHGAWTVPAREFAAEVRRYADGIGSLLWAAPQDWMCEPHMLGRTGLTVAQHQLRTVRNLVELRELAPEVPFVPVLQGWALDDYLRCVWLYSNYGVDLAEEPLVGVGSVCRRQSTSEAAVIFRRLASEGLRLHGFGVKVSGTAYADALASADSMAWSSAARWDANHGLPSCEPARRRSCSNCLHYALSWRENEVLPRLDQLRLWEGERCVAV